MNLYPYQQELCAGVLAALERAKRVVMASPTGSGKTEMAIYGILPHLPQPVLWITHRIELAAQAAGHGAALSVQMVGSHRPGNFSSIIVDEGHHATAATYRRVFAGRPERILALTATPYRMDGTGLGKAGFNEIVFGPDILTLTKMGYLCPALTLVPSSEAAGGWKPEDCAKIVARQEFRRALVYCRRVADAEQVAALLPRAGCLSARTPAGERAKIIAAFRSGEITTLCNQGVLTEGYDLPDVDCVVLNRLTASRGLWKQMVGRGLRRRAGKTHCTLLDLAANATRHGSIYDTETYTLDGQLAAVIPVEVTELERMEQNIAYQPLERLKLWKKEKQMWPAELIENLHRASARSLLDRFLTA